MTVPVVDVDSLPPTQCLILDVLAARYRMGEQVWTFSTTVRPAVEALAKVGLVSTLNGVTPKTIRARLTDAGRAAVLLDSYETPVVKRLRADLRTIARYAEDAANSSIADRDATLRAIAESARRSADRGDDAT